MTWFGVLLIVVIVVQAAHVVHKLQKHLHLVCEQHSVTPSGSDARRPIDDVFISRDDTSSLPALHRWATYGRAKARKSGGIFDTGFRCVSEGGDIFYFDPDAIVDLMDAVRKARDDLREARDLLSAQQCDEAAKRLDMAEQRLQRAS